MQAPRIALAVLLLPSLLAPVPGLAQKLEDRVIVLVDEDAILQSGLDQAIGLGLKERREGEAEAVYAERVLEGLIDQRLRYHEVDRFGFARVPVELIEEGVEELRSRFASPEAFEQHRKSLGLSEREVGQLVARQLAVLTYVDERLGSRVFVSLEDIRAHYRNELVPALESRNAVVPPVEEVREEIRTVLKERRLNEEIARWTADLRRKADVQVLVGDYPSGLPPVVETFTAP